MSLHQFFFSQFQTSRAEKKAQALAAYMNEAEPSGLLGDSRLANIDDVERADMLNTDGLYLGTFNGRALFFPGEAPLLTYLRTGGGKGISYLLPNLAHSRDRSLVVIDVKDAENLYASIEHRKNTLGHKCIVIDPFGITGRPSARINPLARLVDIVQRGDIIDTEAEEIAKILLPPKPTGDDSWARQGAESALILRMEYLARYEPEAATLSGLWRFANSSKDALDLALAMMASCDNEGIAARAASLRATIEDAPKQWEAYKSEMAQALSSFEPGKTFANATDANEFSFGDLKHTPHTVYICFPSGKIGVAAIIISLLINHAIEEIAREVGALRTTFLLDEFPQLPPAPAIMKALRLYRGRNLQLWLFGQGRNSMRARWSADDVREFEDQAGILTFGYVQDTELARDIGFWSGQTSVVLNNRSHSGGAVEAANAGLSETKRDLLQPEDIFRATMAGRQIIKVRTLPYLLLAEMTPYFKINPWKYEIKDVRTLHMGHHK